MLPSTAAQYKKAVKEYGLTPLSERQAGDMPPGSNWGLSEILTFRAIFKILNKNDIPGEIVNLFDKAKQSLKDCPNFSHLGVILNDVEDIRRRTHQDLRGQYYSPYSVFLTILAELSERPPVTDRGGVLRNSTRSMTVGPPSVSSPDDGDVEMVDIPSSPPGPPSDAPVTHHDLPPSDNISSDLTSSEMGASTFGDPTEIIAKAEKLANCLIVELLQLLSPYISDGRCYESDDGDMNLEWSMAPDTFEISLPGKGTVTSVNDGVLVRRQRDSLRNVVRMDKITYASVEAKNTFRTDDGLRFKPDKVYAQELSQILGMIQQRVELEDYNHPFIPLVSVTHHYASLLVAIYSEDYVEFLITGDKGSEPFLTIREFGAYDLRNFKELTHFSALMIAVVEYLKEAGPIGE